MLEHISWSEYTKIMVAGLACWYGYVAVAYYRRELAGLLKGGRSNASGSVPSAGPSATNNKKIWSVAEPRGTEMPAPQMATNNYPAEPLPSHLVGFHEPESTMDEPQPGILDGIIDQVQEILFKADRLPNRHEVIGQLRELVQGYPSQDILPYKSAVNGYLLREGRAICNIVWDPAELESIWTAGPVEQ